MTSDFPHGTRRHLTADGLVLLQVARNGEYVTYSDGDGRTVTTADDDPNSWDAVCPDCDGLSTRSPTSNPGRSSPCGTCGGAGTVDTIPAALIGVGSVLHNGWATAVLVRKADDRDWFEAWALADDGGDLLDEFSTIDVDDIGPDGFWTVVRAVPPAGGTT